MTDSFIDELIMRERQSHQALLVSVRHKYDLILRSGVSLLVLTGVYTRQLPYSSLKVLLESKDHYQFLSTHPTLP